MKSVVKLFALLFSAIGLALSPALSGDIPNMPSFPQEQGFWCWAASDQMVLFKLGYPGFDRQCAAANKAAPGCSVPGDCCNRAGDCNQPCTSQIRKTITASDVGEGSSISWTRVQRDVNFNHPFIIKWQWSTGGTHIMVGTGFTSDSLVHVFDPISGGIVAYPYFTTFRSSVVYAWYNLH
jgi:hypothetical protein